MDLSFSRFDRAAEVVVWPGDLAVLMIGVAARQRASRTAGAQAGLPERATACAILVGMAAADVRLFAPRDGAFHGGVAASLARWASECSEPSNE